MIRNFYSGNRLQYDSIGKLTNYAVPSSWTLDGLERIERITLRGDTLRLKCTRLVVTESKEGLDYITRVKDAKIEIDINFGSNRPGRHEVDALFSKIFVLDGTALPDLAPSYWKVCIATAIKGVEKNWGPKCRFSSHLREAIGLKPAENSDAAPALTDRTQQSIPPEAAAAALPVGGEVSARDVLSSSDSRTQAASNEVFRLGHRVSPPEALYTPDPNYVEAARKAKFQGTCGIGLVIDSSGLPKNLEVKKPLGYGLDEQAIAAVQSWKFKPGMKDGKPVAVIVMIEVSFHLY